MAHYIHMCGEKARYSLARGNEIQGTPKWAHYSLSGVSHRSLRVAKNNTDLAKRKMNEVLNNTCHGNGFKARSNFGEDCRTIRRRMAGYDLAATAIPLLHISTYLWCTQGCTSLPEADD